MRKVLTIDCDYLAPRFAAAYLRIEGDRALFIDNNTTHSVPKLLAALRAEGMSPNQVQYVIITHVHLDHAGGTSALMRACPKAQLLLHPRAARHMINPSKLIESARAVYGRDAFAKLYGDIGPIEALRVREMADGEKISFGQSTLRFLHTRGHANHHFCIHDPSLDAIFTGDAFGLAYPDLQFLGGKSGLFIFPSTSPTDFDAAEAHASVDRIIETGAKKAYLTHYGEVTKLSKAQAQLHQHLDFSENLLEKLAEIKGSKNSSGQELTDFARAELHRYYSEYFQSQGSSATDEVWRLLKLDLDLNAQGLAFVAEKRWQTKIQA